MSKDQATIVISVTRKVTGGPATETVVKIDASRDLPDGVLARRQWESELAEELGARALRWSKQCTTVTRTTTTATLPPEEK